MCSIPPLGSSAMSHALPTAVVLVYVFCVNRVWLLRLVLKKSRDRCSQVQVLESQQREIVVMKKPAPSAVIAPENRNGVIRQRRSRSLQQHCRPSAISP